MQNEEKNGSLAHIAAEIFAAIRSAFTPTYTVQPAVMYHLNETPPVAMVRYPEGTEYKIEYGGQAYIRIAGMYLPLQPGQCPHPEAWAKLYVGAFFWRHGRKIALVLVAAFCLIAGQVIAACYGLPNYVVPALIGIGNVLLLLAASAVLVAAILHNFGQGITVRLDREQTPLLLSANTLNIAPDILVASANESEQANEFLVRVRDAKAEQVPGAYIVIVRYRTGQGIIVREHANGHANEITFGRGALVRDIPGWYSEVSQPKRWDLETWPEFQEYVAAFVDQFRVWAKEDRVTRHGSVGLMDELKATARQVVFPLLLLLASFGASAQSAVPIPEKGREGVGRVRHSIAPDSVETARRIDGMRREIEDASREIWGFTLQAWEFVRYVLELGFYLLLCVAGLTRFAAKAANNESRINYFGHTIYGGWVMGFGRLMTGITFFLVLLVMLILLVDIFIRAVCGQLLGVFGLVFSWKFIGVIGWFMLLHFADRVADWIVPNPKVVAPGNRPGLGGGNGFKQIG